MRKATTMRLDLAQGSHQVVRTLYTLNKGYFTEPNNNPPTFKKQITPPHHNQNFLTSSLKNCEIHLTILIIILILALEIVIHHLRYFPI